MGHVLFVNDLIIMSHEIAVSLIEANFIFLHETDDFSPAKFFDFRFGITQKVASDFVMAKFG